MSTDTTSDLQKEDNLIDESKSESIAIVWHVDDVLGQCPTLSRDEALQVLHALKYKHDANNPSLSFKRNRVSPYFRPKRQVNRKEH